MEEDVGLDRRQQAGSAALDGGDAGRGVRRPSRRYRSAQYSHQLTDAETEAAGRWLVRIVPLVFGAALGSLAQNFTIGVLSALFASVLFDLSMEQHSLCLRLYRRLRKS